MAHKVGVEDKVYDFRSDTVTYPDQGMVKAMCSALVGDDVKSEDATVNELQVL
jgi:threonine aldolase